MTRLALSIACAAVVALMGLRSAFAAGQFIEDIRISRRGDEATISIELACPMRFQSDVLTPAGVLIEIRVAPLDGCRELGVGGGIASELYRPASGRLAHLVEVEYESLGLGDNLLLLTFDRPVDYRVAQRGDLRTLELRLRVEAGNPPPIAAERPATSQAAPVAAPTPAVPSIGSSERAPLTARVRAPETVADYVINLQSTRTPADPSIVAGVAVASGQRVKLLELGGQGAGLLGGQQRGEL